MHQPVDPTNTTNNPFDLVDWSKTKYITFDPQHCRMQCFDQMPILSFKSNGEYYHASPNGHRAVIGYLQEHRDHMEEEFTNLFTSLSVYAFDEAGFTHTLKVLSFDESGFMGLPNLH